MSETCAECGHRFVHHGDRAIAACDGGTETLNVFGIQHGARPLCSCTGWKPREGQPPARDA